MQYYLGQSLSAISSANKSPRARGFFLDVFQQLGQPVLGALLILETDGKGVILQLVGETLTQRLGAGELDDPYIALIPVHIGTSPAPATVLAGVAMVEVGGAAELVTGEPPDTVDMVSDRRFRGIAAKVLGEFQFQFQQKPW